MNRQVLLAMALGIGLAVPFLGGCQTNTETAGENYRHMQHTMVVNMREIPDDAENLLLLRSPSQLSNKPIPIH